MGRVTVEMGVEPGREGVETSFDRIEARIHPCDQRVETSVHARCERVDPGTQIEERPERRRRKHCDSRPDGSIHLEREPSTRV